MTARETEIRQFVIENFLFGQDKNLNNSQSFLDSGIIDSTGVLELIGFLESQYGISIQDDELVPTNLDSVERVASFVEGKLKAKGVGVA